MTPRSRLAALLLLAVALVCSIASTGGNIIAPPLIAPYLTPPFTPAPLIPAERTAYVAIHFEDYDSSQLSALDSETSLQGIRTMMATVRDPRRGASSRDRVVLVPRHTPAAVRSQFESDGLIVLEMDSALPHQDICAPKFDRIYLWHSVLASRYDRVLYLDWDVLVQRNMDSLFLCGEFCMVYNSILHFVDGLMVVKPDMSVFENMVERYKRDRLSSKWASAAGGVGGERTVLPGASTLTSWIIPNKSACWERSYLFFLEWFGNMEAAPLFNRLYGQSPLKLQRLDASAQLNAMMWYEKYSWTLMRGKEYRNMTDDQEVPALSLGFTTLKPFHWGPGLFFNLGWDWSDLRDEYLGVSHTWFVVSRMILWAACLFLATKGLKKLMMELYKRRSAGSTGAGLGSKVVNVLRAAHMKFLGPTEGYMRANDGTGEELVYVPTTLCSLPGYWLPLYGSDVLGVLVGSLHFLLLVYSLTWYTLLIPILTNPHWAWRVWMLFHILGVYAANHWMFLSYHACPPLLSAAAGAEALRASSSGVGGTVSALLPPSPPASALHYPFLSTVSWLAFWEALLYFLMRRSSIYPEFVVKMFVMFPLIGACLICSININRAVWRSIEQAKAGAGGKETVSGGGAAAAVQMQPLLPGGGEDHRR